MNAKQIHEEIKEINLSFMLLAQQMIKGDKNLAMESFGVNEEMADLVAGLSPAQLLKMSASNMLLCCFRFEESLLLNMVTDHKKNGLLAQMSAAKSNTRHLAEAVAA
jgi:flagellar transcriptional activator FlhD